MHNTPNFDLNAAVNRALPVLRAGVAPETSAPAPVFQELPLFTVEEANAYFGISEYFVPEDPSLLTGCEGCE